ncbi:MAG: VOC family protein [Acidimicrobiales bacterium]
MDRSQCLPPVWERFQEVGGFVPATRPDPAVLEQVHLDLHFADRDAAVARAAGLGARRLPRVTPSVYRREAAGATAGMPLCVAKQVTRPVRHREAQVAEPYLS